MSEEVFARCPLCDNNIYCDNCSGGEPHYCPKPDPLREAEKEFLAKAEGIVADILNIGALDEHQDECSIKRWHDLVARLRSARSSEGA